MGGGIYVDDRKIPGVLFAAVLRSPYAHAEILTIDLSRVLSNPLVKAVITQDDVTRMMQPLPVRDPTLIEGHKSEEYCLAVGKVRYCGEPIVAVAAVTQQDAVDALEDIDVEYRQLPVVVDPVLASKPGAPLLFDSFVLTSSHIMKDNLEISTRLPMSLMLYLRLE